MIRRVLGYLMLLLLLAGPWVVRAASPTNSPPGAWVVEHQGKVLVRFEAQDRPAAQELLHLYSERLPDIAAKLGVGVPSGIQVFIAPTHARFRYLTRGLPEWTGGVAYPRQKTIILQAPRLYQNRGQFDVVALHEGIHILTDHDGPSHLPRWLSEGLAMYLSGESMYKHRTPLGRAVVFGHTYTLDGIDQMLRLGPEQARVAYLQSIHFVEFMVDRYGWGSVASLVKGYKQNEDPDEMFTEITGRDFFEVEAAWHRDLRHQFRWWQLLQWINFDTILWSSATLLVIFSGGLAIYRRRKYLKSQDDDEPWGGGESEEPIPGEWYVDDDYWR